jgi:hypothetical protein
VRVACRIRWHPVSPLEIGYVRSFCQSDERPIASDTLLLNADTDPGLVAHVLKDSSVSIEVFTAAAGAVYRGNVRPDYPKLIDGVRRILGDEDFTQTRLQLARRKFDIHTDFQLANALGRFIPNARKSPRLPDCESLRHESLPATTEEFVQRDVDHTEASRPPQ